MKKLLTVGSEKFWVLADQVIVSGGAFCTYILLAKALGLKSFGYFSAIGLIQVFLLSLSLAVGAQVFQVTYPSANEKDQKHLANGFFWQQVLLAMIIMLTGFIISLFWSGREITASIIRVASLAIAFYLLQDFLRKLLLTKAKARQAFIIDAITNLLQLLLLFFAWQQKALTHQMAWAIIAFTFIPSLVAAYIFIRPKAISVHDLQLVWQYQKIKCGWLLSSSLLQWGSSYFFVLAAGWWLGATALGALRLAQYIFGLLNVLLQAVENYALPKAAANGQVGDEFIASLTRKLLMVMFPVVALLAIFSNKIMLLAGGQEYRSYSFVMMGLSVIYLLMTIGYPVRIAIRSLHLDKSYFVAYCFSVGVGISSAPFLIKTFELYGVLAGMFLTQLICISYWVHVLQNKKSISWKSFISS